MSFGLGDEVSSADAAEWAAWSSAAAAAAAAAAAVERYAEVPMNDTGADANACAMDTECAVAPERRRRHSARQPVPSLKVKLAVASARVNDEIPRNKSPSRTLSKRSRAKTSSKATKKAATQHGGAVEAAPRSPGRRRQRHLCPHCDKLLDTKYKLERHVRTHTGEKPFKCEMCPARFNQKSSLKTHSTIHAKAVLRDPSTTKTMIERYAVNGYTFEAMGIPYAGFVYDAIHKQRSGTHA